MKIIFLKLTAGLTLFFFIFSDLGRSFTSASPPVPSVTEFRLPPFQLEIPSELGSVDALVSGAGPTLFHIQEAHGEPEGQKKIKAILDYLKNKYDVRLVLLEGSAFRLKPLRARILPKNPKLNSELLEFLIDKGIASGTEYFVSNKKDVSVYGIETPKAYVANGIAFREVMMSREKSEKFLIQLRHEIERQNSKHLNKDLRAFLKRMESFDEEQLPIKEWLDELKKQANGVLQIDLANPIFQFNWPMLVRIHKLQEFEQKIDNVAFEKERNEFLAVIASVKNSRVIPAPVGQAADSRLNIRHRAVGPAKAGIHGSPIKSFGDDKKRQIASPSARNDVERLRRLLSSPLSHQQPSEGTIQLFERMIQSLPRNFNYAAYPNVNLFIGHLILQSELSARGGSASGGKANRLISEIQALSDQITNKLAVSDDEKHVIQLINTHKLLKKLFSLKLTPEEYELISKSKRSVSSPRKSFDKLRMVSEVEPRGSIEASGFRPSDNEIGNLFDQALSFYRWAKLRNKIMIRNVKRRLKQTGQTKAVVITGGFHASPFEDHFSRANYNYALITPMITPSPKSHENYIESILKHFFVPSPKTSSYAGVQKIITPGRFLEMAQNPETIRSEVRKGISEFTAKNKINVKMRSESRTRKADPPKVRVEEGGLEKLRRSIRKIPYTPKWLDDPAFSNHPGITPRQIIAASSEFLSFAKNLKPFFPKSSKTNLILRHSIAKMGGAILPEAGYAAAKAIVENQQFDWQQFSWGHLFTGRGAWKGISWGNNPTSSDETVLEMDFEGNLLPIRILKDDIGKKIEEFLKTNLMDIRRITDSDYFGEGAAGIPLFKYLYDVLMGFYNIDAIQYYDETNIEHLHTEILVLNPASIRNIRIVQAPGSGVAESSRAEIREEKDRNDKVARSEAWRKSQKSRKEANASVYDRVHDHETHAKKRIQRRLVPLRRKKKRPLTLDLISSLSVNPKREPEKETGKADTQNKRQDLKSKTSGGNQATDDKRSRYKSQEVNADAFHGIPLLSVKQRLTPIDLNIINSLNPTTIYEAEEYLNYPYKSNNSLKLINYKALPLKARSEAREEVRPIGELRNYFGISEAERRETLSNENELQIIRPEARVEKVGSSKSNRREDFANSYSPFLPLNWAKYSLSEREAFFDGAWERSGLENFAYPSTLKARLLRKKSINLYPFATGLHGVVEINFLKKEGLSRQEERFLWKVFHYKNSDNSNRELYLDESAEIQRLMVNPPYPKRILDMGSGPEGKALQKLKLRYEDQVDLYGIDMEIIKHRTAIQLVEGDIRDKLPYPNDFFDLVYESNVLHYFVEGEELGKVLHEALRVLKPGGKLILTSTDLINLGKIIDELRLLGISYEMTLSSPYIIKKLASRSETREIEKKLEKRPGRVASVQKDVPRFARYRTLSDDLRALGYGYYHLPIIVIDSLGEIDSHFYKQDENSKRKAIESYKEELRQEEMIKLPKVWRTHAISWAFINLILYPLPYWLKLLSLSLPAEIYRFIVSFITATVSFVVWTVIANILHRTPPSSQPTSTRSEVRSLQLPGEEIGDVVIASAESMWRTTRMGGVALYVSDLAKALAKLGVKVTVVNPLFQDEKGELVQKYHLKDTGKTFIVEYNADGTEKQEVRIWEAWIDGVRILYLENPAYFKSLRNGPESAFGGDGARRLRFARMLSLGTLLAAKAMNIHPKIIQSNDWSTAFIRAYWEPYRERETQFFPVLHSATTGHQGRVVTERPDIYRDITRHDLLLPTWLNEFDPNPILSTMEQPLVINPLHTAIVTASEKVGTVSRRYRDRIVNYSTPVNLDGNEFGGLEKELKKRGNNFVGISNGFDQASRQRDYLSRVLPDPQHFLEMEDSVEKREAAKSIFENEAWNRQRKLAIQQAFHLPSYAKAFIISMMHRIDEQKGHHLLLADIWDPSKPEVLKMTGTYGGRPVNEAFEAYPEHQLKYYQRRLLETYTKDARRPLKALEVALLLLPNGILGSPDEQIVIAGSVEKDSELDRGFREIAWRFPRRFSFENRFINTHELAYSALYEGSDLFLMPSREEPGGLAQREAHAHAVPSQTTKRDGLLDTLIKVKGIHRNNGNEESIEIETGMEAFNPVAWVKHLLLLHDIWWKHRDQPGKYIYRDTKTGWEWPLWNELRYQALIQDTSWDKPAREYINVYRDLLGLKPAAPRSETRTQAFYFSEGDFAEFGDEGVQKLSDNDELRENLAGGFKNGHTLTQRNQIVFSSQGWKGLINEIKILIYRGKINFYQRNIRLKSFDTLVETGQFFLHVLKTLTEYLKSAMQIFKNNGEFAIREWISFFRHARKLLQKLSNVNSIFYKYYINISQYGVLAEVNHQRRTEVREKKVGSSMPVIERQRKGIESRVKAYSSRSEAREMLTREKAIKILQNKDASARAQVAAIKRLQELDAQDQLPLIAKKLAFRKGQKSYIVRWTAIGALGDMKAREYEKEIMKYLSDVDRVKLYAIQAMTKLNIPAYEQEILSSSPRAAGVFLSAVREYLRHFGFDQPKAMTKESAIHLLQSNAEAKLQVKAIKRLQELDAQDQIELIASKLNSESDANGEVPIINAAISALSAMGARSYAPKIAEQLDNIHSVVIIRAIIALKALNIPNHRSKIEEFRKGERLTVTKAADVYLRHFGFITDFKSVESGRSEARASRKKWTPERVAAHYRKQGYFETLKALGLSARQYAYYISQYREKHPNARTDYYVLNYDEALRLIKNPDEIKPYRVLNSKKTAKNLVLAALDRLREFNKARMKNNIGKTADIYRREVIEYEADDREYVKTYRVKDPAAHGQDGQQAFFYEVGGLRSLMNNNHEKFLALKNSPGAVLDFALPGLVDDNNPNALKRREVYHKTRSEAREKKLEPRSWNFGEEGFNGYVSRALSKEKKQQLNLQQALQGILQAWMFNAPVFRDGGQSSKIWLQPIKDLKLQYQQIQSLRSPLLRLGGESHVATENNIMITNPEASLKTAGISLDAQKFRSEAPKRISEYLKSEVDMRSRLDSAIAHNLPYNIDKINKNMINKKYNGFPKIDNVEFIYQTLLAVYTGFIAPLEFMEKHPRNEIEAMIPQRYFDQMKKRTYEPRLQQFINEIRDYKGSFAPMVSIRQTEGEVANRMIEEILQAGKILFENHSGAKLVLLVNSNQDEEVVREKINLMLPSDLRGRVEIFRSGNRLISHFLPGGMRLAVLNFDSQARHPEERSDEGSFFEIFRFAQDDETELQIHPTEAADGSRIDLNRENGYGAAVLLAAEALTHIPEEAGLVRSENRAYYIPLSRKALMDFGEFFVTLQSLHTSA